MKTLCCIVLLLAGCAATPIADQLAGPADGLRDSAEVALCRAITVGSWMRAYGNDPEKAQAWRTLCSQAATQTPAK